MTHTMCCLCAPDRADSAKPSVTYILSKSFVTNTLEALMHVADDGKFLPNEGILDEMLTQTALQSQYLNECLIRWLEYDGVISLCGCG